MREVFMYYIVFKNGCMRYSGNTAVKIKSNQRISYKYIKEMEKDIAQILEDIHDERGYSVTIANICYL